MSKAFSQTSFFQTDSMFSTNLNEQRYIQTYLPPQYEKNTIYPIILATDGQVIADGKYNLLLDSLIQNKIIKPVILIAPHSNEKMVPNSNLEYRNLEYVLKTNGTDKSVYINHKAFFTDEAIRFISTLYAVNTSGNKVFYGFSNGAALGIDLASSDQIRIDNYICLSPLGSDIKNIKKRDNPPHIYIAYGDKEEEKYREFGIEAFTQLLEQLKAKDYPTELHVYNGGHDRELWKIEFVRFIIQILNNE